jgi:hypothetical protein
MSRKDVSMDGIRDVDIDITFHFNNDNDTKQNIRLLQGLTLPFEEPRMNKSKRKHRSRTIRKRMKKIRARQQKRIRMRTI